MQHDKVPSDNGIIRFSLDIWQETGLLKSQAHEAGRFYFSERFAASEFNFFMPDFKTNHLTARAVEDIKDFYAEKRCEPVIYCPDKMIVRLRGDVVNEIRTREVYMKGDAENLLADSQCRTPGEKLVFERLDDFSDPRYLGVYNRVFLSPDSKSQYDEVYTVFIDLFGKAAKGGASFKPWVMMGSVDGEAVTAVTVVPQGRLAGIYNLATPPEWEKKGFATAVLRQAYLAARKEGVERFFLITDTGSTKEKMYKRRGFASFARYTGLTVK